MDGEGRKSEEEGRGIQDASKMGGIFFFFNKKREGNSIGYLGIFWEKRESNVKCGDCTGCFKNG